MKALVTCSGVSNAGRLTTQVAVLLMQRRPGRFLRIHTKQSAEYLRMEAGDAESLELSPAGITMA